MEAYFFESSDVEHVEYLPEKHLEQAHKFLFLQLKGKHAIVIGSKKITTHSSLLNISMTKIPQVEGIFGGGIIKDKKVVHWSSDGLLIKTPKEFHPIVQEALGVLK